MGRTPRARSGEEVCGHPSQGPGGGVTQNECLVPIPACQSPRAPAHPEGRLSCVTNYTLISKNSEIRKHTEHYSALQTLRENPSWCVKRFLAVRLESRLEPGSARPCLSAPGGHLAGDSPGRAGVSLGARHVLWDSAHPVPGEKGFKAETEGPVGPRGVGVRHPCLTSSLEHRPRI